MAKKKLSYEEAFLELKFDKADAEQEIKEEYVEVLRILLESEVLTSEMERAAEQCLSVMADLIRTNGINSDPADIKQILGEWFLRQVAVGIMIQERAARKKKETVQ